MPSAKLPRAQLPSDFVMRNVAKVVTVPNNVSNPTTVPKTQAATIFRRLCTSCVSGNEGSVGNAMEAGAAAGTDGAAGSTATTGSLATATVADSTVASRRPADTSAAWGDWLSDAGSVVAAGAAIAADSTTTMGSATTVGTGRTVHSLR